MSARHRFAPYPRREPRAARWLADLRYDLRYAVRQLRRAPGLTALLVSTLAIGIGANATMVSVIDRLLFRPPPHVRDPGRLVRLVFTNPVTAGPKFVIASTSYPAVLDLRRQVGAFGAIEAYSRSELSLGHGADAIRVRSTYVTPAYFALLGVTAYRGRLFGTDDGYPTDGSEGGPPLAVLSYGFWQRQFAGATDVLGRTIPLGTLAYTIVGITPAGFRGVEATAPDVWLPVSVAGPVESTLAWIGGRNSPWLTPIARLRPWASRASAGEQATTVMRRTLPLVGWAVDSLIQVVPASVILGRGPDAPRQTKFLLWIGAVSVLVLLIACANVANLLLGRAVVRRRELAVRLALGAGQGRLARQLLAEALLLVGLGGVAALVLAMLGSRVLENRLVGGAVEGGVFDVRLFAFTAAVALGTAGLIALVPWLQSTGLELTRALHTAGSTGDVRAGRARTVLLGTQAALAMLMVVAAMLFVHSLRQVRGLDLGIDAEHTLTATFDADRLVGGVPHAERDAVYRSLEERVRSLPGVERVSRAETNPYGSGHAVGVHPLAHDPDEYWHLGVREVPIEMAVDSGYFRTVGATSLRGRDFESTDRRGSPPVTIIDDALAKILWPHGDALGQCLIIPERGDDHSDQCVTVVGVLPSFRWGESLNRGVLMVYRPLAQSDALVQLPSELVVRIRGDGQTAARSVRRAIQSASPDLPAVKVTWMRDQFDSEYRPWEVAATMFSLFGAVALVIAVVGLYGVVSFAAAQRTSEIAIRRTLGAGARDVLRTVAGSALRTVVIGLAAGTAVILMAHRWLAPLLYQTSARDPWIIAGVAAALLSAGLAASLIPTARALRRNLADILRME